MSKKAFSFVETIIAVAIIALIATIGFSYKSNYDDNKFNAKIQADLASLNNAFLSYKQENENLPIAKSNNNFFKSDSSYAHDENDDAFGVHGFVTDDLIPKKYLDSLPLDPRTNQFYAYGKTLSPKKLQFEFAGITKKDGVYQTIVSGNYDGKEIIGLIREYNGPQFLYNKSTENFPFNPEERLMTAKIGSYSGSVSIIKNGNTINSNILNQTLVKGDSIKVNGEGFANIYYSDGSRSTIESNSELVLTDMDYKSENNLLTKVKLTLSEGSIWTKATRLNPEGSEFDISTEDATAAVRGTIFKIEKNGNTKVIVEKGKVGVKKGNSSEIEINNNQEIIVDNNTISSPTPSVENFTDNEIILPSSIKPLIEKIENNIVLIKQAKGGYYLKDKDNNIGECNTNGECDISNINTSKVQLCTKIGENKENCSEEIKINKELSYENNEISEEEKNIKELKSKIIDSTTELISNITSPITSGENNSCQIAGISGIINDDEECEVEFDYETKIPNQLDEIEFNPKITVKIGEKTFTDVDKIKNTKTEEGKIKEIKFYGSKNKILKTEDFNKIILIKNL